MTPEEAIAKLKALPEDKQRQVLGQLSPEDRSGILKQLSGSRVTVGASPSPYSWKGIKGEAMTLRDKAINLLPTIGGTVGGVIGGGAGIESGPGAILTAGAGAAAGGGLVNLYAKD